MDAPIDSGELVDQCLRGEPGAARRLYELHAPGVMVFLLRSGFEPADAEDLTQDVFFRAMRSLKTYRRSRGSLKTWLGAIARNAARRRWSRRQAERQFDPDLAQEPLDGPQTAAESLVAAEEARAVAQCMQALPKEMANLLRLRYVEGLTTRGVAEEAHMPEATVRSRLAEAITRMTKCLKSKGFAKD